MSATVFARSSNPVKGIEMSDSRSSTMSSASRRIVRKPDERSSSKRSFSRTNSQKSDSESKLGSFFVKIKFDKENSYAQMATRRSMHMTSELTASNPEKKREPTPKPGHIIRRKKGDCDQIESEVLIADLQNRLNAEKEKSCSFQKRLAAFERDIKTKTAQISQLEALYQQANALANERKRRLQEIDSMGQETETSLGETKSTLNKLKGNIRQNRMNELESEIKKLKQENLEYKKECARLEGTQMLLMTRCEAQEKEIAMRKLTIEQITESRCGTQKDKRIKELEEILAKSRSEREALLENVLTKRNMERTAMSSHISKLEIQIAFLNRKKNEEIASLREKKQKETHALRDKLSTMYHRQKTQTRECRWRRSEGALTDDEDIELELSPDHAS